MLQKEKREIYTRLLFIAIFLNAIAPVVAQEKKVVTDLHLCTGVKIEKTFAKDWTISLEEEIRLKHNMTEINNYFTEAGLRYRINKNFALEGDFRYTRDKKQDNTYESLSRYNFDLRYKGKLDFLTIYYRLRYQKEVEDMKIFDLNAPYEKQFRNRITIGLNSLKKIEPYVSAEIFQVFTPYVSSQFKYYRVVGGIRYEPGRFGQFNVAWGFNRELVSAEPAMIYMFKIKYKYEL